MIRINYTDKITKEDIIQNHTTNGGVVCFSVRVDWTKTGYVHLLDYMGSFLVEDGQDFIFDTEFEFYPMGIDKDTGVIEIDVVAKKLDYYIYGETEPYTPDAESIGDDFG